MRAADQTDADSFASVQSEVLGLISAEREQSLATRLRDVCVDMRLFWPAVGASGALTVCLCVASAVMGITSPENPDSLAGMIHVLANPGSDRNPMRLDGGMVAPPRALNGAALDSIPGDEAVFALAAVVTREGRVANYEVLMSERASVRRHDAAVQTDDVSSVLNAVKQSRFSPAQASAGVPVAVNMVWVLARTTVKAPAQAATIDGPAVPVRLTPAVGSSRGAAVKPDVPSTSLVTVPSTTA